MEESVLIKKRFTELAGKAYGGGYFTFTDFLGLAEQTDLAEAAEGFRHVKYTAFGGAEGAERVMIRFGDAEELGYSEDFPIVCIKAEPTSQKFADRLTHRDFLGALLNLGIERSTLGDIPIIDNVGYIFAKKDIAPFIIAELKKVKHTDMRLSEVANLPEGDLYRTENKRIQASGERLDGVIAKLYGLSRDEALSLFKKRLVYIDGRLCENNSKCPKVGAVVSVRGHGRFIYKGYESTTKKGRLNIDIEVYI